MINWDNFQVYEKREKASVDLHINSYLIKRFSCNHSLKNTCIPRLPNLHNMFFIQKTGLALILQHYLKKIMTNKPFSLTIVKRDFVSFFENTFLNKQ